MLRWGLILNLERFQAQPKWDMSGKRSLSLHSTELFGAYSLRLTEFLNLLLTAPRTFTREMVIMTILALLLLIISYGLILTAYVWLVLEAFGQSVVWGVVCLLCPPGQLVLMFMYWEDCHQ